MNFEVDPSTFDQLFPFSFQTTPTGELSQIGRSLKKLFPTLSLGKSFFQEFKIVRPRFNYLSSDPKDFIQTLTHDLLILSRDSSPFTLAHEKNGEIHLRGQVIPLTHPSEAHLFLMTPAITEIKQITSWNLDFSDFPIGDPIFDLLILLQSERNARQKSDAAKSQLEWENRISHLLHHLTLATTDLTEAQPAIALTLRMICRELDWQIGHAFIRDRENPKALVSSGIWYLSDPERLATFQKFSQDLRFLSGEGCVGKALEIGKVIWINHPTKHGQCIRHQAFAAIEAACCVDVPILVHGEVVTVLEFISEEEKTAQDKLSRFFEISSHQLASVIERQENQLREKEQLAGMATSSKLAAIGEMAAGVGHEINNPLTAVLLSIQWLQQKIKEVPIQTEPINKVLLQMKSACDRIAKIVAGLKFISREGTGDPFIPSSIKEIIEDSLILCQSRFKGGGVKLHIKPVPADLTLYCRPIQISQIILNLLGNAFDAVTGKPQAWIELEVKDLGKNIELVVTDSGTGIPAQVAEKIMRPFFTTKAAGKGTGLGLSVSAKIVSDHHGRIYVDRECPHTRFIVLLPKNWLDGSTRGPS